MKIRSETCSSLPSLLNGFSAQQRPEDRIQRFLHVLYQDHVTRSKRPLYRVQVAAGDEKKRQKNPLINNKVRGAPRRVSHPLCPMRMTRRPSPYLFLIHLTPCSCGSTMRGQRWQEVRMVAFSVDILSAGRPSFCHAATSASSVSRVSGSRSGVTGIGTLRARSTSVCV